MCLGLGIVYLLLVIAQSMAITATTASTINTTAAAINTETVAATNALAVIVLLQLLSLY